MAACIKHVQLCRNKFLIQSLLKYSPVTTSKWLHTCVRTEQVLVLPQYRHGHRSADLLGQRYMVCAVPMACSKSTMPDPTSTPLSEFIPEPPPLPEIADVVETLNALGEPAIQSLGLGGWTPPGLVQQGLEMLHVSADMPWWAAIVTGTIVLRLLMFPLVIKSQKNAAHMHNHMPTIQRLQARFSDARSSGDQMAAAKAGQELMTYMQRNNVKVFKNFLVPLAQLPVFVSVFMGMRQMATLPIESMKVGGILWFTDLTVPDPFFALPLLTMATFLLTVEVGVDGLKAGSMGPQMKWIMRGMPILIFPFIHNFPTAMLCYWFTSNGFSLVQLLFLKIPAVRTYFGIEAMVQHDKSAFPKKKGFVEGFKESMNNAKMANQMKDRQRLDALQFKKAGEGPIQKTYSYDPTNMQTIKPAKVTNINMSAKPKS